MLDSDELPVRCIWCGSSPADSLEHIVPDSLGCPEHFVLRRGVCAECNRKNGKLDRSLLKPFEIMTVINGIRRKGGKRPTVDGLATMSSGYDENGPAFFINREKFAVRTPGGKMLAPTSKLDEIEDVEITHLGESKVNLTIRQRLLFDRKAVRGLFKIALETIAYHEGLESVAHSGFDHVRKFVMEDAGNLAALMMYGGPFNSYITNRFTNDRGEVMVPITIMQIGFVCDFDASFKNGRNIAAISNLSGGGSQKVPNWPV